MVTVRRTVRRPVAAPPAAPPAAPVAPAVTPSEARGTWRCEHCHGTLRVPRGTTREAVAAVHLDSCPAVLRVRR